MQYLFVLIGCNHLRLSGGGHPTEMHCVGAALQSRRGEEEEDNSRGQSKQFIIPRICIDCASCAAPTTVAVEEERRKINVCMAFCTLSRRRRRKCVYGE